MNANRLRAKDLITTAIFTVVFSAVVFACSMIFGMAVLLYPFLVSFIGLFGGVVWAYMRVKVPKPFAAAIQCCVCALLFFLLGTHWAMTAGCVLGGLLADVIAGAGKYKNFMLTTAGYCAWCLCVHVGAFLPVLVARDYYYNYFVTNGMDVAWSDRFFALMSPALMLGTGAFSVVCAVIGMLFGRVMLKKHFAKAGVA